MGGNSPEHLEVKVAGAHDIRVLQSEVGLRCQILLVGVGGPTQQIRNLALQTCRVVDWEFSTNR